MSSSPPAASPPAVVRPHIPLWVIVTVACVAQFMVVLDTSVVNVALPDMKSGLGLSTTGQQWVVNGYLITLGGFLLLAARASDLFGRRRVFQAGLVVFTLASLAGGLAQDQSLLLIARFVQGIGAAALAPASLSLITATHSEGHARAKALSIWAAAGASAGAFGLVLGGVLTSELSWRWVFFINLPIGIGLIAATVVTLMPASGRADWSRLDVPGAITVTVGIGALVFGISEATERGWGSAPVVLALVAAAVLLGLFGVIETRSASPLVPLNVFANRALSVGNLLMAAMGVALTSTFFFLSLYEQQVLGYSALRTGMTLLPMTLVLMLGAIGSRRLVPILGPRRMIVGGAVITAGGLLWMGNLPVHAEYATHLLGPTALVGLGMSQMMMPITIAVTAGVTPQLAGLASGLANMSRQVGGAVGLAVLVTIASSVTDHSGSSSPLAATVHGFNAGLIGCGVVSLLAALLGLLLPGPRPAAPSNTEVDAELAAATGH